MLFNEPKLLKSHPSRRIRKRGDGFSALQRAEIAEISTQRSTHSSACASFSALQRAEIAEIYHALNDAAYRVEVSVLFNEPKLLKLTRNDCRAILERAVSVLFNEPKLLKFSAVTKSSGLNESFSALQRAEIAEIRSNRRHTPRRKVFQCSSTSRNC